MQKMPVPSLDPHRYAETFAVFVAHSLEYPQMLDELARVTAEHLREGFRVLDVGAGTGLVVRQWIERTGMKPSRYTAFEPNPGHVEELTATVAGLGLDHDILARPFTLETVLPREFDIALFSHSLYWMPDPALHLLHATGALADGGLALAFIGGPYGLHAMFRLFEPYLERSTPMLQNNAMSSHELVQGLRARGVEPQVHMLPTPIDLTGLFEPEAAPRLNSYPFACRSNSRASLPGCGRT